MILQRTNCRLTCDQRFDEQGFVLLAVLQHPLEVFLFALDGHLTAQLRFGLAGLRCSGLRNCKAKLLLTSCSQHTVKALSYKRTTFRAF